jgi:aminoglycoside phosphotransferase (APT) family kinase protein
VLSWIDGDVGIPPLPGWVTEEAFLMSVGELLRRIHDALAEWQPSADAVWSSELVDPRGGPIIVHSDICPENVIARDGKAVAIIDWEFAAPGRRVWDVVSTARLCVPYTAPVRRDPAYAGLDVTERLRVFLDSYGLAGPDRAIFVEVLAERRAAGERLVRGRVANGEAAFHERWGNAEGEARLLAERAWIDAVPVDVAALRQPK